MRHTRRRLPPPSPRHPPPPRHPPSPRRPPRPRHVPGRGGPRHDGPVMCPPCRPRTSHAPLPPSTFRVITVSESSRYPGHRDIRVIAISESSRYPSHRGIRVIAVSESSRHPSHRGIRVVAACWAALTCAASPCHGQTPPPGALPRPGAAGGSRGRPGAACPKACSMRLRAASVPILPRYRIAAPPKRALHSIGAAACPTGRVSVVCPCMQALFTRPRVAAPAGRRCRTARGTRAPREDRTGGPHEEPVPAFGEAPP